MSENRNSDEIDLIQLIIKAAKIVENNLILILSFFVVGSLIGFLWYSTSKEVYESKLLLSSRILTQENAQELIEGLNELIKERNIIEVAKKLNLSGEEAREISKIEIEETKSGEKKEPGNIYFTVIVHINNKQILPNLQNKIIQFFENNNFVKIRVQQRRDYLISLIKKVQEEISGLEEFKTKIYSGDFFASTKGNVMFDPTIVNTKILDLTKEKIGYEQELVLVNSVQVVDGFTAFEKPISPKLSISIASGSFVGLFFVVALIAFKALRRIARMEVNP